MSGETSASWGAATLRCLRLQLSLANARALPRLIAALVLCCGLASVVFSQVKVGQAHRALAESASLVIALMMTLTTIMGAVAVSADRSSGALRALLLRPVPRSSIIAAHAILLLTLTAIIHLGTLSAMAALSHRLHGFGPVLYRDIEIVSSAEMGSFSLRLLGATLPAVLCAPLLGLAVSVLVDGVVPAVVLALALVLGPLLFGRLASELPTWVFTQRAMGPLQVLEDLSRGITLEAARVESPRYLFDSTLPCALWGIAFLAVAGIAMRKREFRS